MLQIKNKIDAGATLLVCTREQIAQLPYLDGEEKKILLEKVEAGMKVVTFTKKNKLFIVFPYKSTGNKNEDFEALRIQGYTTFQLCKENKEQTLSVEVVGKISKKKIAALLTGITLSSYEFLKYQPKAKSFQLNIVISETLLDKATVSEINLLTESVRIAKDLVNEPVSYLTATQYSKEIQKLGKTAGFQVTVWDQKKIEQEKMGGIIAVNRGSSAPATFNILEYTPKKAINKKPLVLVGKGVVYDTGGLSLKPTKNSMDWMKSDMAGSAAIVGAMYAIAQSQLPYHVIGLIPAVENRPGYEATCPGDVITMYDGTTVEVLDTDAEGRLILADALHYAKRLKPELVLDFATLTGSALRAIGKEAAVIMGTADKSTKKLIQKTGEKTGERTVEFPFWKEYGPYMKSDIADLKNLGPMDAGAITAGKFLEHFIDYPWMHFDIAGPAFVPSPYNYRGKWATAYGVRLLFTFVQNLCNNGSEKREKKDRHNAG